MSNQYGPRIVTNGLQFCIDPISTKNSISILTDLGPQNCNGSLTNGASLVNNYVLLDGINNFINFTTNNIISNIITIDIWFYISNLSNNLIICAGDNLYNSAAWNWGLFACCSADVNNNLLGRADPGAGGLNLGNISSFYLNRWNNITIVRSGGLFYRNGIFFGTSSTFSTVSDKPLRVGGVITAFLNGRIGPVRIYNRSLSANEILQNYNATKSRFNL